MKLSLLLGRSLSYPSGSDPEILRVISDSRKADADSVFVALRGAHSDGHAFLSHAYDNGCRVFVCQSDADVSLPPDAILILHPDTREAFASLCAAIHGHPAEKLNLIGVTGTKGKTSVAYALRSILMAAGQETVLIGTTGIEWNDSHEKTVNTTPDAGILQDVFERAASRGVQNVIMEVSSQAFKQKRIAGLSFSLVIFTNLSPDHISPVEHPDFDDYKRCKLGILKQAKQCLLNQDDPAALGFMKELSCPCSTVSQKDPSASFFAVCPPDGKHSDSVSFSLSGLSGSSAPSLSFPSPGAFSVTNAAEAAAGAALIGISPDCIVRGLAETKVPGRFETIRLPNGASVIIDYSHNGLSLASALSVLRETMTLTGQNGKLLCLFGTVGGKAENRRAEMTKAAVNGADFLILTSDNPDFESPDKILDDMEAALPNGYSSFIRISDREEAIRVAVRMTRQNDILLLAGKGHETYQLVCGVQVPFSERSIVQEEAVRLCPSAVLLTKS